MRTTSLKTIYLTIPELKEAITRYIQDYHGKNYHGKMGPEGMYLHLMNNEWSMDWASGGDELSISIDGEIEDNKGSFISEKEK